MLDIRTQYANDNQLMCNNLKFYAVAFDNSANIDNLDTLTISEKSIAWFEWCIYLGNKLVSGKYIVTDFKDRKRVFYSY